ncbi:hypothetical protein [Pontibacillus yanchengensis]|uniref:Uncharacterized protein n=1 Tax=Pontibacillus yanchengensis Y32 TaxID=1385514 RepID=A0A0A2TFR1_9BACI|nr:hypothetical protein [Pontibacillus yanchengensis]KGP74364.1 hypothetical protein N782_15585 [Pontibacillus yanchengensis Y32]
MVAIVLFLIGFGLAVSGGVTMIAYLNFLPAGFQWMDYLLFIQTRPECYLLPIGVLLILVSTFLFPNDSC